MAPSQPNENDRGIHIAKANPNSTSDPIATSTERRSSASSGYFSNVHARSDPRSSPYSHVPSEERDQRPRAINGRSNSNSSTLNQPHQHHLETLAQTPIMPRHKNNKDSNDSGIRAFFRSASRPSSPDQDSHSQSHTRKTSFSSYNHNNVTNPNAGTGLVNGVNTNNNSNSNRNAMIFNGSIGPLLSANSSSSLNSQFSGASSSGAGYYQYQSSSSQNLSQLPPNTHIRQNSYSNPGNHSDIDRRRSIDSYSRSSSPDHSESIHQLHGPRLFPTTPPPGTPLQSSMKNGLEPYRSKSNDNLDTPIRPEQESHAPTKEPKKTLFSIFKKKAHLGHHHNSSQSQPNSQHPRPRKASDDFHTMSPSTSIPHAFSLALFPDPDLSHPERRHYDDTQRGLHVGKKHSKSGEATFPGIVFDIGDMSSINNTNNNKNGHHNHNHLNVNANNNSLTINNNNNWLLSGASGSESWMPPESWGVQPPSTTIGTVQRSQALTPEDSSEDMDISECEDFKKKVPTVRIFRPDTTYTTINCTLNTTASKLSSNLGKKIFKPDTSKYHLYMLRNNIVRQLGPNERPLNILRKCLLQFGYTDQDKLEELCGKDNSFLCRFTFEENGTPLTTEADIQDHADYADVNLQRRCLPTIPIFLYSKAKDIVRLNISHNQRMDLPLDFVQNCSILRELRMAYNDLGRVPGNVRSIIYLQVLDLRGNRIKDLEKAHLEDARELVTLLLQCNRLETIPNSFQTFEYLRILNLSGNNFSKVPLVLCRIASLEELDLSFNEIADIPEEIGQLSRLRKLLLFGNRIGPYLPSAIDRLLRLRKLDIRQNGILNLDAVSKLPVLQELLVDYNTNVILSGSFKALVKMSLIKCNMTDINLSGTGETLTSLDLSSNKLSNLPPTLFENLRSLEVLILENNSIGSIAGIGTMKRLKVLMIANNNLSSLPEEIGLLDSLITLDIHSNNLSELPTAIWRLSLISLNVSSNLLDTFPDPPKSTSLNGGSFSNSALTYLEGPMQMSSPSSSPSPSRPKHLPIPLPSQNTCVPYSPPLAMSLHSLCLSDNRLPDEVMYPLSYFTNLQILNLSHNYIAEIPRNKIPNVGHIVELYLSGNQLTSLPAEDIERLRNLRVLHVNGNRLTTLPAELGKINRLVVLDVGCNMLKYNISNWPYDWNWNWNLELKYLNMSGNKRLQIKRTNVDGAPVANRQGNLSEFGNLTHLRCLGLMDVTITDNVPENSVDRRVRTSMSTLHNMSYGMADTLGVGENLCIWDLVHPKFQTKEDESLFGLFDGRSDRYRSNSTMTSHLKDRFGSCLKIELEKMEGDTVSAIRRTFLGLDRELFALAREDEGRGGASALVAYIKGTTLYSANVGDAIAVLVKKSDTYQVVSQKHIPWNPTEASRIKRSGGFVSESGLLNDELDISRSFGQYHLVPIINSNPYIETTTLTEDDDFLIMASSAFWDVMSYTTAVDIAKAGKRASGDLMYASQKLRDIAISYGAKEHMVVMLIGVGDLFKERELDNTDYHQPTRRPKAAEGPDTLRYLPPEIEPPQGDVAMVFTDIKNSTKLWENVPKAMQIAIKEHFIIMRRQLRSIGGYEVKNEGDALMASFTNVPAAMLWCFKVQELLVNAEWPQDILDSAECKAIFNASDPQPMYRGLSVRMGIHWGRPVSDRDAVTRRMDYYGPMVNRAARICDCADGGEICVSSDVINVMHLLSDHDQSDSPQAEHIRELKKMGFGIIELGEKKLKGLETPENIHLIYSRSLAGRIAMASRGPVLEIVESTALDSASVRALQTICLRLERLASSGESTLVPLVPLVPLLAIPIKDNADQDDLARIAEHYICRIENCFSQLYMAKTGHFVEVFESLGNAIGTDPSYILRALQMYCTIVGSPNSL